MTNNWIQAANIKDIEDGSSLIIEVQGKEIGIFHAQGVFYAVLNVCPHARAPVCKGRVQGTLVASPQGKYTYEKERLVLRCPWHHWEFELESGRPVCNIRQKIKTYKTRISDGKVWLLL